VLKKSDINPKLTDIHSVQGVIELALQRLRSVNEINSVTSSRTDAGVHALSTTIHVDLERQDKKAYNPFYITSYLNNTFFRYEIPIRVNSTYLIPTDLNFHCRYNAIGRTYLYRLAVLKPSASSHLDTIAHFVPIEETDRCFFLQKSNFDLHAVEEVLPLFKGLHDFRTFMGLNPTVRQKHCMFSVRTLDSITLTEGKSQATLFSRSKAEETYTYFDILISGRSFLYRQVRRIVGVLIAVAQGKLTKKDVYELITIPSSQNWPSLVQVMPPHGLYLCEVRYRPEEIEKIRSYNESFEKFTRQQKEVEAH